MLLDFENTMNIDLTNKKYLVTGGSRGIGKAIVERLANAGATVAFTYKSSDAEAQKIVEQFNHKVFAFKADISDENTSISLIENIENQIGELDGLINNAGITMDKPFFKMETEAWQSVINTNLNGTFYLSKAVINKFIRKDNSKIINMASVSGLRGSAGQANYSASKAAMIAFTKTLAVEFARFNVQVNAIAPGFIETEMTEQMDENIKKNIRQMVPARRMGRASEVADAVLFLLSPSANYITGHTLVIDGGLMA
ncbi:3-oxoacyl-[acyl-carrier protein] reductase [Arcicella aurantiaca]|uniref:3-oxoacyl-[acyl-carrier protein] reductase n=2 Tax=Arcicella aurantiaca TaxID=591202 RepID=A0A316DH43_9BACT|nr:3-oxoacyl-[acyl-carrier protein] reductase [Arcicella aurantiaca]